MGCTVQPSAARSQPKKDTALFPTEELKHLREAQCLSLCFRLSLGSQHFLPLCFPLQALLQTDFKAARATHQPPEAVPEALWHVPGGTHPSLSGPGKWVPARHPTQHPLLRQGPQETAPSRKRHCTLFDRELKGLFLPLLGVAWLLPALFPATSTPILLETNPGSKKEFIGIKVPRCFPLSSVHQVKWPVHIHPSSSPNPSKTLF